MRELPNWNRKTNLDAQLDDLFEEVTIREEFEELEEGVFKPIDFVKHNRKYSNMLADMIANGEEVIVTTSDGEDKSVIFDNRGWSAERWKKYFGDHNEKNLPADLTTTDGEKYSFLKIEKTKNGFSGRGGLKSTQGKEVWQGIGFYIWGGIADKFQEIRKLVAEKKLEEAAQRINSLKDYLYKKDIIDENELPQPEDIGADLAQQISLMMNGSVTCRQKLLAKDADFQGEKLYVIRQSIREYYAEMKRIGQPDETEIPKENTSDIVITNTPDLLSVLKRLKEGQKNKITYNNKTGLCKYANFKFMQVSLKMLKGKAPFGNAKGMIADMTGITHEAGLSGIAKVGAVKTAAEEVSPVLQEIYSVYESVLQESAWSYLSNVATKTYGIMRTAYMSGLEFVRSIAESMRDAITAFTGGISDFFKADQTKVTTEGFAKLQQELGKVMMEDNVEDKKFKKASELFDHISDLVRVKDQKSLKTYAKAIANLANQERKEVEKKINTKFMRLVAGVGRKKGIMEDINPDDVVKVVLQQNNNFALQFLYVNHLSFLTIAKLLQMIQQERGGTLKKAIEIFDGIRLKTSMGYTFLPIVRVYGGEGDPEILSYENKENVVSLAIFDKDKPYLVVSIKQSKDNSHYDVDVLPFAGIDIEKEKDNYKYIKFTFGTNTSAFVYNIVAYTAMPQDQVL